MEMEDKNRSSNECSIQILFSGIEIAVQNKNRNYDKKQNKNKHNSNNQNNDSYKNDWDEYTDLYVYIIFQELIYSCGKSTEKKHNQFGTFPTNQTMPVKHGDVSTGITVTRMEEFNNSCFTSPHISYSFFCQMSRSRPVLPEVFSWLKVFSKMSTNLPASTAHG